MLTAADITDRARKLWTSGRLLRESLIPGDKPLFPFEIQLKPPSAKQILYDFSSVQIWIKHLTNQAPPGVEYRWKQAQHRQLGTQSIPTHAVIATADGLLSCIKQRRAYDQFHALAEQTLADFPELKERLAARPHDLLAHADAWPRILQICRFFRDHPCEGKYLRQLQIPEVDTKFIETHRGLLTPLLDRVLPKDRSDPNANAGSVAGFCRRFGLATEPVRLRVRLLDPSLAAATAGLLDFEAPIEQIAKLDLTPQTLLIVENKTTGLIIPQLPGGVTIFGLGYATDLLRGLPITTQAKQIFYWGDIDTHGFRILDQLRAWLPRVQTILMDEAALLHHHDLCVTEPPQTRHSAPLNNLIPDEQNTYRALLHQTHGENLRLEQERIPYPSIQQALNAQNLKPTLP